MSDEPINYGDLTPWEHATRLLLCFGESTIESQVDEVVEVARLVKAGRRFVPFTYDTPEDAEGVSVTWRVWLLWTGNEAELKKFEGVLASAQADHAQADHAYGARRHGPRDYTLDLTTLLPERDVDALLEHTEDTSFDGTFVCPEPFDPDSQWTWDLLVGLDPLRPPPSVRFAGQDQEGD